ncbi:MAG: acyltransferase family protein [Bacteroidales bacterium]
MKQEIPVNIPPRLASLDALRGFDLFSLLFLGGFVNALARAAETPWLAAVNSQFQHVSWEGFAAWDLVMPLFMFMAGVSMPFSFAKYGNGTSLLPLYRRILRRVVLLWIFGAICQGNLLAFDPARLRLYSNTLQAIAMGYAITALLVLHLKKVRYLIAAAVGLLLLYWASITFLQAGLSVPGSYERDTNLAEWIDRAVLQQWRDGVSRDESGGWSFSEGYRYTWILSSLNFGVTVLSGYLAGFVLYNKQWVASKKVRILASCGVAMIAAGWLWSIEMPVIKMIWTSSMTLVSSGYCFLLMALFYYLIDYKGYWKSTGWLRVIGMNSIVAYVLVQVVNFRAVSHSFLFGMEQFMGDYYRVLLTVANFALLYGLLYMLHKNKLFIRL